MAAGIPVAAIGLHCHREIVLWGAVVTFYLGTGGVACTTLSSPLILMEALLPAM